ncbi:MAG: transcriptional repressor [Rhodospirillaceae bacterium]|nr:MAG: transcriptional repressor [Rhodospirillaceae bacterium]
MARTQQSRTFPQPGHNHDRCAVQALARAEALCDAKRLRFTSVRRRVLATVWASHAPIGAYDILAQLNAGGGRNAPMAVYRALDFLLAHGLVHRVASLNAFVGCAHPGEAHSHKLGSQLLICRACGSVVEFDGRAVSAAVARAAPGFAIESEVIEISGLCPHCRRLTRRKAIARD